MVKRIIFDIDGTLITGVDFFLPITQALEKYGIKDQEKAKQFLLNIKEYEKKYNLYDKDLYLKFFSEKLQVDLDYNFLKIFFVELEKAIPKNSEKVKNVLNEIKDYELVLLSNYFEESQRNRLTAMGINHYFSEYYGEKIIKPNVQSYKSAMGNYQPNECLMIGDNKKLDIDIPKSLGFKTIWIDKNGDIENIEELNHRLIKNI